MYDLVYEKLIIMHQTCLLYALVQIVALQAEVCICSIKTAYHNMNNICLHTSDNRLVQHLGRLAGEHPTFLGKPTETQCAVLKHAADAQHKDAKHDLEHRRLKWQPRGDKPDYSSREYRCSVHHGFFKRQPDSGRSHGFRP